MEVYLVEIEYLWYDVEQNSSYPVGIFTTQDKALDAIHAQKDLLKDFDQYDEYYMEDLVKCIYRGYGNCWGVQFKIHKMKLNSKLVCDTLWNEE